MKYYRDLKPGETLQAGDDWLEPATDIQRQRWQPVSAAFYGAVVSRHFLPEYRRPVDLPVLQPVTPEAMAELEGRHAVSVLVVTEYGARTLNYSHQGFWWRDDWGVHNPVEQPTRGWFIELSKLKEVQQ